MNGMLLGAQSFCTKFTLHCGLCEKEFIKHDISCLRTDAPQLLAYQSRQRA